MLGAPIGSKIGVGRSAGVFLALINNGSPDKLVSISAPGHRQVGHAAGRRA